MENLPKIDLPDYKKIASKVKKRKISVENKEIETALKWLQNSRAKFTALNRPCRKGDFVEIEFEYAPVTPLTQSHHNVSRSSIKDAFILGRGGLIPGFEEKIEGMKSGQEKEFSLSLPQAKESKQVPFKVKMKSVQKMEVPEIGDEWAKSLGKFKNLEELKKSVEQGLYREKEMQESQRIRQEILAQITEKSKVVIPQALKEKESDYLIISLKQNVLEHLKISFEEYLEKVKKTEKEIRESFKPEAEKRVKAGLVLQAICQKENIEVSEEEIKERAETFLKHFENPEQTQKKLDPEQLKRYIKEVIRNEKTLKMLEELARK